MQVLNWVLLNCCRKLKIFLPNARETNDKLARPVMLLVVLCSCGNIPTVLTFLPPYPYPPLTCLHTCISLTNWKPYFSVARFLPGRTLRCLFCLDQAISQDFASRRLSLSPWSQYEYGQWVQETGSHRRFTQSRPGERSSCLR